MKVSFSNHPPPTVPCTEAERCGGAGRAARYVASILIFITLDSWIGAVMWQVLLGDKNDLVVQMVIAVYGVIFYAWITVPWAIVWCVLYYWMLREGWRTDDSRALSPWAQTLMFCEGWGIGQGILFSLLFRGASLSFIPAGIGAGLVCWPVVWWIWRGAPPIDRARQV